MLAASVPGAQRALARNLRRQRPSPGCSSNTSTACVLRTGRREIAPMMTRPAGSVVFRSQHSYSRRTKDDAKLRATDNYPTPKQGLPFYQKIGLTALLAAGGLFLIEYRKGQRRAQSEPLENQQPEEGALEIQSADDLERAARAAEQRQNLRQILAGMSSSGGGKNAGVFVAGGIAGVSRAPPEGRYSYVIIGAGTTANAAVEAILQMQPDADILLLSDEMPTPVEDDLHGGNDAHEAKFQTLNTDLVDSFNQWRRHVNVQIGGFTDGGGWNGGFGLGRGEGIHYYRYQPGGLRIEPERRSISLDDGIEFFYDKCLIANAGKPRKFYAALDSGHLGQDGADDTGHGDNPSRLKKSINTLLSLEDFVCLENLADDPSVKHVTVIGGGPLGSEVALALASRGRDKDVQVSQVYAEKGPMQRLLPPYLATYLQQRLKQAGVTPVWERLVTDFRYNADTKRFEVALQGWAKRTLETDYIVLASTHIDPKVDAARESGLEIDQSNGGIVVNGLFEAVNGVYAAGNLASYFDPALGRRRIGSYDHSVNSGLCAGYNMAATLKAAQNDHVLAGKDTKINSSTTSMGWSLKPGETRRAPPGPHPRAYTHQPIWRSNLMDCDIVIEGVGEIDARLRTVGMWVDRSEDWDGEEEDVVSFRDREPVYQRGIVYYLRGDKVAGVLLFNTSDLLERAREVLRSQPKIKNMKQLKRQIPLAPDDWMRLEETPGSIHFRDEILTPPF